MANPGDLAYTVKQQADIVRVVGDYVKLKKAGAQNFSGLCPFHQEKSPSFSVHTTRQFYHCFGCGVSGDVFSFVQKIENVSFVEAIRLVAEKLDIKLPKMQYSSEHEAQDARRRSQLIEMHERACKFFEDQLRRPEAAHARQYLAGRGMSEETLRTFRIGYAPDSGFLLKDRLKEDYSEELMRSSGLFSWKEGAEAGGIYSKFRNRIVFPIAHETGKVIAFTGRTLANDEKAGPKYLNSPETPIYSKSRVLYNLDKAKDAIRHLKYTVIVEGQMDCISVYAAGFHNVVASSGTAFTETQVRLLARFSKDIVVNFDPDTAGAAATDRSLAMLLSEEFKIKILRLEDGFDPDLFIRKRGPEAYGKALRAAPNFFDYLVERALRSYPVKSPEGKKNAVNYLLPYVQRLPNRIERESLAGDIAQKLGIDSGVLRMEFKAAAARRSAPSSTSSLGAQAALDSQITLAEKILVRAASSVEAALRRQAFDALSTERLHVGLSVESLLETMLTAGAGSPLADPMGLPLADEDRALLARIIMREDEALTAELLEGALEALRHRRQIGQREREIMRSVVEAERSNDAAAILRLKQEKLELDRKLAEGN
jgi:DNA primase